MKNALYFGDCLDVLREFSAEAADLTYLDPPFNSQVDYNILFSNPTGDRSKSQIEAFLDTWHWCEPSEQEFSSIDGIFISKMTSRVNPKKSLFQ